MNIGEQITPTLRLSRLLGQGGMGSVWIADHLALRTQVAVKFMSPAFAAHAGFVERFHREAMAAAQIKSPHVAQVFDHGVTEDGTPYIVMELLEGEDLRHRIKQRGPLPVAEVVHIIAQAAKALGRAHQLGIVHRDIKPDNLFLLDADGEPFVKVLDFGIAKQAQSGILSVTLTGSMMGTPLYMSPEQLLSAKNVDLRADLWALGVVTYYALTGRTPFRGETLGALSVAVHEGLFELPSRIRSGLPPALDAWMAKALQRDPEARFSSAKELVQALEIATGERASLVSADALAAQGPASGASWPGSASAPSSGVGLSSGAQDPTLTPVATPSLPAGRRRSATLFVATLVAGLAATGGYMLFAERRAPSNNPAPAAATTVSAPDHATSTAATSTSVVITPAATLSAPIAADKPMASAAVPSALPAGSSPPRKHGPMPSLSAKPVASSAPKSEETPIPGEIVNPWGK
jgi:serine/threonine protein kinase